MSLPLTPNRVAAVYEMLRSFPPFSGWVLPEADEVKFTVNRHHNWMASHQGGPTQHICVSVHLVGHMDTLVRVVAHEMVHMRQYLAREETPASTHNADFRKKAAVICKYFGFDPRLFV